MLVVSLPDLAWTGRDAQVEGGVVVLKGLFAVGKAVGAVAWDGWTRDMWCGCECVVCWS